MKILKHVLPLSAVVFPVLSLAGPVNVNTADAETISEELRGIGLSKAQAIIEYREKHGPFQNSDELSLVSGIGERTVELNGDDIRVEPVDD